MSDLNPSKTILLQDLANWTPTLARVSISGEVYLTSWQFGENKVPSEIGLSDEQMQALVAGWIEQKAKAK